MKRFLSLMLVCILTFGMAVPAMAAEDGFADIPVDADYAQAVAWCREKGLMQGGSATRFDPEGTLTRAMVATVLYRAAGEPAVTGSPVFTDTREGQWYSDAVVWANEKEIVRGYGNGLFGTDDPVTKEQLDIMIRRYQGEDPIWTGDAALNVPATRAEAATAFYTALNEEPDTQDTRVLVAYYSATGSTENVANYIAEALHADLFELVPANNYTSADLNYNNSSSRVNAEHEDESKRDIELVETTPANWEDYDVVFVGYPIWWRIAAWPVNNFVKDKDFTGKTVIPFCTSASSGLGQSGELLAEMAGEGDWQTGRRFAAGTAREEVATWLEEAGLLSESDGETLSIEVNGRTLYADLADNSSARALRELLAEGPLTIEMSDYGNMEKVGALGTNLPRNDEQITTDPGDIILYQGNNLVIYYDQNTWKLTRLGKLREMEGQDLRDLLGAGNVSVTLSLV